LLYFVVVAEEQDQQRLNEEINKVCSMLHCYSNCETLWIYLRVPVWSRAARGHKFVPIPTYPLRGSSSSHKLLLVTTVNSH